jgi:rhamnose transport system ATP-binding protein
VSGPAADAPRALDVEGLSRGRWFRDVSLHVKAGEIVALFGLVGSGRSELLETIFGIHHADAGAIRVDGRAVASRSPRDAARAGIALVPEERQRQGLFFNLSLRHNLVLPRHAVAGDVLIGSMEDDEAQRIVAEWRIKAAAVSVTPDALSGGNQQKVVLGKWLALEPRVMIFDEPTQGVDVGAKAEIHRLIRRLADEGAAVVMISSDIEEIVAESDRVAVMHAGRITGILDGPSSTPEAIMQLAIA